MIDHVSIAVSNLTVSEVFYTELLASVDYLKLVEKPGTVGYGKKYADFWLNERPNYKAGSADGFHICLRTKSKENVERFYRNAIALGAVDSGEPGFREIYSQNYYASFIQGLDGNKIEVVTFVEPGQ